MNVSEVMNVTTRSDTESFDVPEFVGKDAPTAFHINYQDYGYGKFVISRKCFSVFGEKLSQIRDSVSRK
jgi:hypothetical protein